MTRNVVLEEVLTEKDSDVFLLYLKSLKVASCWVGPQNKIFLFRECSREKITHNLEGGFGLDDK